MFEMLKWKCEKQKNKKELFEKILPDLGFIPEFNEKIHWASPFGYIKNNVWTEWKCVNIEIMREYWDNMFISLSNKTKNQLYQILKDIIMMLPGQKKICQKCQWKLPECFQTDDVCIYCYEKG